MNQVDSGEPVYPFGADRAFIGAASRKPWARYSFDGRRLVIWEQWYARAVVIVAGALMGPGLTALLISGRIKASPWYVVALILGLNAIAWLGWIDALRNRYQVVFDLTAGDVQFYFHPLRAAKYALSLDRVAAIEINKINRIKGKHGNPMRALTDDEIQRAGVATIACYCLVLVRDDGLRIYVVESSDRSVLEGIQSVLQQNREGV